MELELGLKITQTRDDLSSSTNLCIAKDRAGPVFLSRETETMFILTAYLKGYRREMVEIDINEDGTRIAIIGKKPVQEMAMMGYIMVKNEVEIRGFRKVFRIPDGVNLDRIKAKFTDEESILRIVMPKLVKGVFGVEIEEVKEEEVVGRGKAEMAQKVTEEVPEEVPEKRESTVEALKEVPKEPEYKMEETDQVAKEEVDEGGFKMTPTVADEVLEKESVGETMKEEIKKPKIESMEEAGRLVEEPVDEGKLKATKVAAEKSPERDNIIRETLQEESKQPEVANVVETDQVVEKKIDRGGSKTIQIVANKVPEREDIGEKLREESKIDQVETSQQTPDIEHQSVEPQQRTAETASSKELPDLKEQTKRQATPEEPRSEELPDLKEQTKKQTIPEAEKVIEEDGIKELIPSPESTESTKAAADQVTQQSELPNQPSTQQTQVERKHIRDEMPQEPQKQENGKEVQETTKIKPDQEEISQPVCPEVHGEEETHRVENEIQEATDQVKYVLDEHEPPGVEKQKDVIEGATQTKKPDSKKSKLLCAPLAVAGSALLVSLFVIVMRFIRAKNREHRKANRDYTKK